MAIDTYAKLIADIADTIDRSDLTDDVSIAGATIEGAIKRAIRKCEIRTQRTLRVRQFETSTTMTFASGTSTYAMPSDFASARLIYLSQDPIVVLEQTTLEDLYASYPSQATGQPQKFAISGSSFVVRPTPDQAYTVPLTYYQTVTPLTTTNTTNTLLTLAPDAYLYGSCIELMAHMMDDQRVQTWMQLYNEAIRLITEDDDTAKWNGVLMQSALPVQIVV